MTIYIAISGWRGTGFVIFYGYGRAGRRHQLTVGHTNRRPNIVRSQFATTGDGRPPVAVRRTSVVQHGPNHRDPRLEHEKNRKDPVNISALRLPELRGLTADPRRRHGWSLLRSSDNSVMIGEISLLEFTVPKTQLFPLMTTLLT